MKIIFSILLNASILFVIWFLLNNETYPESVIVLPFGVNAWKTYLLGGVILGLLNAFIKPILKIMGLTLFFIYPLISLVINGIILWLLTHIIGVLQIQNMDYKISGAINFIIAVAIFTIMNILYSIIFSKK